MLHTVVVDDFFDNVDDIINLSKELNITQRQKMKIGLVLEQTHYILHTMIYLIV
jgi:hypothetical protein